MRAVMAPKRTILFCAVFLAAAPAVFFGRSVEASSIVHSKHNLSSAGAGSVKATTESEICIFCHIPHNTSSLQPLWSRNETGQVYLPYTSTHLKAAVGQPTGASKLCLSCHDGTVALGMVRSRGDAISFTGPLTPRKNLGVDLSDDHPVSFVYDSALAAARGELRDPSTLTGEVRLDSSGQMQCTSCHDPHDDQYRGFLVMDSSYAALCVQCHDPHSWSTNPTSPHRISQKPFHGVPGKYTNPNWSTIAEYGCQICHQLHRAEGKNGLLYFANPDDGCLFCHYDLFGRPAPAQVNLNSAPSFTVNLSRAGFGRSQTRFGSGGHASCGNCHNSHGITMQDMENLPGSLRGVSGVSASGAQISQITREYELCFRCHGDTASGAAAVNRQFAELNTRLEFNPDNASFHPVEAPGRNQDVPSLIEPLTVNSIIRCTSCHNNSAGSANGGAAANGPHASMYPYLLERAQEFSDGLPESSANYSLCYKCHDRNSILGDRSFSKHRKHIVEIRTACTVCHDSHGVKASSHLINFDRDVVSEGSGGRLTYEDTGRYNGRCYLTCHGEDHNPKSY